MNEQRIRELAEQAGWSDDRDFATWNKLRQWQNFDKEKFAELIVEEMYDFIMEESASDNGIPDLGKVKEHFGVESRKDNG